MRSIILLVLLSACVDFEPGVLTDVDAIDDAIEVASISDESVNMLVAAPACTTAPDCFALVAADAFYPPTRIGGAPWDADGSLPEPVMAIFVNGQLVGKTITTPTFLFYPDLGGVPAWRARWTETVGSTPLHVGDVIEAITTDLEEGYQISECSFEVVAYHLTGVQEVACLLANENPVGSLVVGIQAVMP